MTDTKRELLDKFDIGYDFNDFCKLIEVLRSPEGCPWDREQTHESIKKNFVEETYEVLEAIDLDDKELLCEELGDVLMQVGIHTQMEIEAGGFGYSDVICGLVRKLIVRHPHVFGDVNANTTDKVLSNWESIKNESKGIQTESEKLNAVPKNLPALMRAQKIQKRAASAGFDWDEVGGALDKLEEEIAELKVAIKQGAKDEISEEIGDLFFSCVNVCRMLKLDSEEVLTSASDKFLRRFEKMENAIIDDKRNIKSLTLSELDGFWAKIK